MCTTPGGAACSAPSSADFSPVGGIQKHVKEGPACLTTCHLLRWPVLRRHEPLDTAAAALDARRLQTFADTSDRATWLNRHPSVDER